MNKISEFEAIEDYDLSVQALDDVMKYLSLHAQKEDAFFSSFQLSEDETLRINEVASGLGIVLP